MAKTRLFSCFRHSLCGLMAAAAAATAAADDAEGVVRIRSVERDIVIRSQSPDAVEQIGHRRREARALAAAECPPEAEFRPSYGRSVSHHLRLCCANHRMRNRMCSDHLAHVLHEQCAEGRAWIHCKFGYFCPSGCHGKGAPPLGHYSMVYPLNPSYIDGRDTQTYAAAGYAGPVGVPLAPVVHHQYNYGWGVPSSRLTAISNPVLP